MSAETVTITLPADHALVRHIEQLQATLSKRNATIAALEERLAAGEESPLIEQVRAQGYTRGWKACADRLAEITQTAARSLGDVRKDALSIYYEGGAR